MVLNAGLFHLIFMPMIISRIPVKRQIIFKKEIFSDNPLTPMPVVTIKIVGPTNANIELIINAFSKSLNFHIRVAADNSMLPDKNLNNTM